MVVPPYLFRKIFEKQFTCEIPEKSKNIYLTFDDGPTPEITEFIIDCLNKYNAKATFFCVGENIKKYPEAFKLYTDNHHVIGNHTYNHLNGWKTNNEEYYKNIFKCQKLIPHSQLFRPPYGKIKISQLIYLKRFFKIYLWSVISNDFDQNITEEQCLKNVLDNAHEGSIVVFHDNIKSSKNLKYALPKVLQHYTERGFSFKSL